MASTRSRVQAHPCPECTAAAEHAFCPPPQELMRELATIRTARRVDAGEFVFLGGDDCDCVFIVCAGRVKLMSESADGKVLLLRFAGPGEILGAGEAMRHASYDYSAAAAEASIVASIPRDLFLRFVRSHPEMSLRLATALSHQYTRAQREIRFLAFGQSSTARLARLLLEWADQRGEAVPDGIRVAMRLSQAEIAQAIGSNRETVTRLLSDFTRTGVVERGPGAIVIRDAERLRRASRL